MLDSTSGVRKTDLAVIILQKNEKLHIRRCLEKLAPLAPRQIFVVDCFSTDGSDKIASEMGRQIGHGWRLAAGRDLSLAFSAVAR